jgi:hypothetical protein
VEQSSMTARTMWSASENNDATDIGNEAIVSNGSNESLFAANLSIHRDPVQYRVLAGDAVTLWHTLTPQPRPRIRSFTKRYQFPAYAKLPDRSETSDDGDLRALVGTRALVTVEFDEPVDDPTFKFGVRGPTYPMESVDGSTTRFDATIPIKTPSIYQVDATSSLSGLNNPFSPQYTITPIVDTPPMVHWADDQPESIMASPLDVVSFSAVAVDDLPMDKMIQEYQVNREPLAQRSIEIPSATKEVRVQWDWDLLHRETLSVESKKLAAGDVIRTRFVAIDRLGNRGETSFIEVLVLDENFDADRHQRLDDIAKLTQLVIEWTQRHHAMMDDLRESLPGTIEVGKSVVKPGVLDELDELLITSEPLLKVVRKQMLQSQSLAEARNLELIGRGLIDADQRSRVIKRLIENVDRQSNEVWKKSAEKQLRAISNEAKQLAAQSERIEQLMRTQTAMQFTYAVGSDVAALHRSVKLLTDDPRDDDASSSVVGRGTIPKDRMTQHLVIVSRRLKMIDDLVSAHASVLPESTVRHFDQWTRWSNSWMGMLQQAIESPPNDEQLGNLVDLFQNASLEQYSHSLVDGRLSQMQQTMVREIPNSIGPLSERIDAIRNAGRESVQAGDRITAGGNSDATAMAVRDQAFASDEFQSRRDAARTRIESELGLHRNLPSTDLRYAADLNLIGRAIENVSSAGYVPYKDESPDKVYEKLSRAFRQIEGVHEARMGLKELQSLREAERSLRGSVREKFDHPNRIDRYVATMEWPARTLRDSGIDWKWIEPIDRSRYSGPITQAQSRIGSRRWNLEKMISSAGPISEVESSLAAAIEALDPMIEEARQTIQRYVLSLPEQAENAAQATRDAMENQDSPEAESPENNSPESDSPQRQAVDQEVEKTLQALVDFANNADVTDEQQRELARDADAAAAQINDAKRRADESLAAAESAAAKEDREQAMQTSADAMNDLAESLEQTAEHFRSAEQGDDVSESREAFRQAEQDLQVAQQLEQRFAQAKAMASAATSSPEELLQKLEQELTRNQPMQQELSDIARQAAESAQATLERAAREESALEQALQRSDPSIREQKARAARDLAQLARRAATIDQSLLNAADRAGKSAAAPKADEAITQARQTLRKAVDAANTMGGEQASLQTMQATASEMTNAIEDAKRQLDGASKAASEQADQPQHNDDQLRSREAEQLERSQRDVRTQRARAAGQERQDWTSAERDAGRRVQQAQRDKRDAERAVEQTKKRLEQEKNDPSRLQDELRRNEDRLSLAERSEQAARETVDFAEQKRKDAEQRERELSRQKLDDLEQLNPAAELADRMASQAKEELSDLQKQLRNWSSLDRAADAMRASQAEAAQLAERQDRITDDVAEATRELQRAGRHEERLGRDEAAERLDGQAESIADKAQTATQAASQALSQSADDAGKTPQANQKVAQAKSQLEAAAQSLADALQPPGSDDNGSADNGPAPPSDASGEDSRAARLAQTLDELDRALNGSNPSQPQAGSQSPSGDQPASGSAEAAANDQAAGNQPGNESSSPSQPGGDQPASSGNPAGQRAPSPTAGDLSPTLAGLLEAQAQAAARQRQQQITPPGEGDGPPSDDGSQADGEGAPSSQSGSGPMPDGGEVETSLVDRAGDDWGTLRQQRTDETTESASAKVPSQYRAEIEAYFREIARQSARTQTELPTAKDNQP